MSKTRTPVTMADLRQRRKFRKEQYDRLMELGAPESVMEIARDQLKDAITILTFNEYYRVVNLPGDEEELAKMREEFRKKIYDDFEVEREV